MCYSLRLSALSLSVGLLGCYLLVRLAPPKYRAISKAIALFFAFVYLMQLIEMMMWTDQECNNGLNRIASSLGPLLNHLQPVVLLVAATAFLPSARIIPQSLVYFANAAYVFYVIYMYGKYVSVGSAGNGHEFCTRPNAEGHLDWPWKHYFEYGFYFFMMILNAVNYYQNPQLMIALVVSFALLYVSGTQFTKNIGEFWCLMVVSVPYVILAWQS